MNGTAADDEVDGYIELWHASGTDVSLVDWLRVSHDDYAAWVGCRLSAAELLSRRQPAVAEPDEFDGWLRCAADGVQERPARDRTPSE